MPECRVYARPDSGEKEARALDELGSREFNTRRAAITSFWRYYYGQHRKHLAPDSTGTDDNVVLNLIGVAVDKSVSALMGVNEQGTIKGPDFELAGSADNVPGPDGRVKERPEIEYLNRVWAENNRELLLHEMAVSGAISGDVFLKVIPDEKTPRLVLLNAANVSVFWRPDDMNAVVFYRLEFGDVGRRTRQDVVNDGDSWVVYDYSENGQGRWRLTAQAEWPYRLPPIVHWKNLPRPFEVYGKNDLGVAPAVNDSLNFVASNTLRIIKFHAHPATVATGVGSGGLTESGVDRLWTVSNPDAKIYNVEMQSDLGSSMKLIEDLRRAVFDTVREIDPQALQSQLRDVTNFGLRVLYKDALEKNGTKRLLYGRGLQQVCNLILMIGGFSGTINVMWPDPLPIDALGQANALTIDRQNGLSQRTYLERRGYDPDVETAIRETEEAAALEKETLRMERQMLIGARSNFKPGPVNFQTPRNMGT